MKGSSLLHAWLATLLIPAASRADSRIYGGQPSTPNRWPWMAALVDRNVADNFDGQSCGGSLVHPYWVVTAAHCASDLTPQDLDVVIGANNLATDTNVIRRHVAEIIVHPNFSSASEDSDVALLLLEEPIFTYETIPIIDDTSLALPGRLATVTGWGDTTNGLDAYSKQLREVQVPIVSNAVANAPAALDGDVTDNMIAAGYAAGGKDACAGDSGGPLMVPGPNGVGWRLAGVVSWGLGCAEPNRYGVYTRLSKFRSWINSYVYPNFAAFEAAHGLGTEALPDADRDRLTQWQEFGLASDPSKPSIRDAPTVGLVTVAGSRYGAITFRRHTAGGAPDVSQIAAFSPDARTWTALDPAVAQFGSPVAVPGEPGVETVTMRAAAPVSGVGGAGAGFFRLNTTPSRTYVPTRRHLGFPGTVNGELVLFDAKVGTSFSKDYLLDNTPSGTPIAVTLRATAFDAVLQILNASTSQIVATDSLNSGGGTDDRITFVPQAGTSYFARVLSAQPNATGHYSLTATYPAVTGATIGRPATVNGFLSAFDPPDPLYLPDIYYTDDYRLTGVTAPQNVIVTLTSSAFDTYLEIVDANSGDIVAENDDISFSNTDSRLQFTVQSGKSYLIRVTTVETEAVGSYTLQTQ